MEMKIERIQIFSWYELIYDKKLLLFIIIISYLYLNLIKFFYLN